MAVPTLLACEATASRISWVTGADDLTARARWTRIGRYVSFPEAGGVGAWLGTHFRLWRDYGRTPLWVVFSSTDWGRSQELRRLPEPWGQREGVPYGLGGHDLLSALTFRQGRSRTVWLRRYLPTWQRSRAS